MDPLQRCSVVIPIYKETPSELEWISFIQAMKILPDYRFSILTHRSLNLQVYTQELASRNIAFQLTFFDQAFFTGIPSYNALLLNTEFYENYSDSEFILIYQLDAFVFRNELEYWCSQNYDYIGAPWFTHFSPTGDLWRVGNGGFSLRKVRSFLHILQTISDWRKRYNTNPENFQIPFPDEPVVQQVFENILRNDPSDIHTWTSLNNEDHLWGMLAPRLDPDYITPTPQQAIPFSFECDPAKLFSLNQEKLPFGCHAWERYDPTFWATFIQFPTKINTNELNSNSSILQKIQNADPDRDAEDLAMIVGDYLDENLEDNEVRDAYRKFEEIHFSNLSTKCTRLDTLYKDKPYRISCIVSSYSSAEFLKECLDDLVNQTVFSELEIILIDACSPENEAEVARPFLERYDNIRYYRTPTRIGIYPAWSFGCILAKAPYIIPFSANDRLLPNAFEVLANTLDKNPMAELTYGDSYLTDKPHQTIGSHSVAAYNGGTLCWPEISFGWLMLSCGVGPHPMWRKRVHESIGYLDRRYKATGDQDFFLRIARRRGLLHTPCFTGMAWLTNDSLSGKPSAYAETFNIQLKYFKNIASLLNYSERLEIWKSFHNRFAQLLQELPKNGCKQETIQLLKRHKDFFTLAPNS